MKITIRGVYDYADLVSAIASITNSALILGFFDQEEAIFSREGEPSVPTADELAEMVGLDRGTSQSSGAAVSRSCPCRTEPGRFPARSSTCRALRRASTSV